MAEITADRLSEMAQNASVIAIDGKVLDVSDYLDEHPGGGEVIEEYNGKDATGVFHDIGHSKTAQAMLEKYEVGAYVKAPPPPPTSTLGPSLFIGATIFGVLAATIAYYLSR